MVQLGIDLNENAEILGPKADLRPWPVPGGFLSRQEAHAPKKESRRKPKPARYLPVRGLPPGNVPHVRAFPALREPKGRARRPWSHGAKPLEEVKQSPNQATKTAA